MRISIRHASLFFAASAIAACTRSTGKHDPVTADPETHGGEHPAAFKELDFESEGARLNGVLYIAAGTQARPTVLLLHGFPGNERNSDVAQTLRRAGMNVLLFDYRGSWGSGGEFSFTHALDDVKAALEFVRRRDTLASYHGDPARIALLGHSMGAWLSLMVAADDPNVVCAGALETWNVGASGREIKATDDVHEKFAAYTRWLTAPGAPLHVDDPERLIASVIEQADAFDIAQHAAGLKGRPILLLSAANNTHHTELVRALEGAGASITVYTWPTDHAFSDRRIQLARTVLDWLESACAFRAR
jgi:pimeloyl-ACP methyl ester carboxylesterase